MIHPPIPVLAYRTKTPRVCADVPSGDSSDELLWGDGRSSMALDAAGPESSQVRKKVLIVDGHRPVREALRNRLRRLPNIGAVVGTANLRSALEYVKVLEPDVVLCDPRSLGKPPEEVVQLLSGTGSPVVVLTTSIQEDEEQALKQAGAATIVLKGHSFLSLVESVFAVIGQQPQ